MNVFFLLPGVDGFLIALPFSFLWAYLIYKWDFLSILMSFGLFYFFSHLMLIFVIPEAVFGFQTIGIAIILILLFLFGALMLFRSRSAREYENYIPGYVGRIREKERFLRELEIARGVQMKFLPQHVPQFPSLEIVSLCQPAMEVGGDYYDFIQVDEGHMSVLIGDVSGKGVSAAFYMTMVKGIIKTLSKKIKTPAKLLMEANEIFFENAPRDVFITMIYGIFDLPARNLNVARAGHNPLVVWRNKTNTIEIINPKGIALGLKNGEQYESLIEERTVGFEENDVFVFYTDGVTETMNLHQEVFGEERLHDIIKQYAGLSPQELQLKIVNAVTDFAGKEPQHDDFTMVIVKIRPQNN